MKRLITLIIFLLLILMLMSCSSTWRASRHLRIANKHILKAEAFGAVWSADTVYKVVDVVVPQVKIDTLIQTVQGDTVFIDKERLSLKFIRLPGDSIFIEAECKADTIYKEIPVTVNRQIYTPDKWKTPALAMAFCLLMLIIASIGYLYLHRQNNQ